MAEKAGHSPLTAHEHDPLPCGYAPRALHLSYPLEAKEPKALFVGAKDGSIQAVVREGDAFRSFPLEGCSGTGVRALSEWEDDWLWVGRRGGKVELIDVREPKCGVAPRVYSLRIDPKLAEGDAVRALGRIDEARRFLSFQKSGTWVVTAQQIGIGPPEILISPACANELRNDCTSLSGILFVVPFQANQDQFYVLANKRGEVFVWDERAGYNVRMQSPWPEGEAPSFVNDFSILWADRERPSHARGVFLATDRGVHLLHATTGAVRCRRLALPGLGAVCMAITYAEPSKPPFCYLWAADTRGDGHLYWARRKGGEDEATRISFLPSGLFHAGSQSMLATSWWDLKQGDSSLVVCEARRNDEIVLTEYTEVGRHQARNELEEIRRLLSHGDAAQMAGFWKGREDPWVPSKLEGLDPDWPPYAQLSELFELLTEKTDGLDKLLEFLGDPSAEAASGILRSLGTGEECRTAIELWTLSLLGVLNRAGGKLKASERDSGYLGIIRWLRDLHRLVDTSFTVGGECREAILRSIDTSVSMVRKWGLFGEANARRENLIRPLLALREQVRRAGAGHKTETDEPEDSEAALDLLTYEVLIFERGVALREEDRSGHLPGRNGWDVSFQQLWGRDLLAVSWHWGWVELYELKDRGGAAPQLVRLQGIAPLAEDHGDLIASETFHVFSAARIRDRDMQAIPKPQSRHSRAVLLGRFGGGKEPERAFLLTAPTLARGSKELERLHLWEIRSAGGAVVFASKTPVQLQLPTESGESDSGESVSSFLDLGSGWVLVGLSGQGGTATCMLVRIVAEDDDHLKFEYWSAYRDDSEKKSETSGSEADLRNRVWSLAQVVPSLDRDRDVLAGCEDGSILRLKVRLNRKPAISWSRVARMRSPVKALACRYVESRGRRVLRLFAGGANGSILAWQEVRGDEKTRPAGNNYASLWAVHEGEEVAGIHLVDVKDRGKKTPLVLAITRDERFVFFNDLDEVGSAPFKGRPKRIPLPGCRHGTLQRTRQERASTFATCLVPPTSGSDSADLGRVAAVLTASKHGVLRLLSLHYPHFLELRKKKFAEILKAWDRVVRGDHLLRLVHAAYRTAPSLELILVRWLLDPAWPEKVVPRPAEPPIAWKVPRNLRQLVRLSKEWASAADDEVYKSLLAALREAFRLDDLLLYQEICEVALQRGNCELSAGATKGTTPASHVAAVYLRVFEAIEESIQQWRGGVNQEESLARMNVARNLVDGDTFFRLATAAARGPGAFDEVVSRRIRGVRDLILKGGSRVTLEALRAANLSMLRLCKRLQKKRTGKPEAPLSQLPQLKWHVFKPYFEVLMAAAARTFHSPLELTDVAEHSYARAFALAVYACPSAALRIATRLTETRLISDPDSKADLCWLVPRQFEALAEIGIRIPADAQALFTLATRPPEPGVDPLEGRWLAKTKQMGRTLVGNETKEEKESEDNLLDRREAEWQDDLGAENALDLRCLWRLYVLVNWFSRLEESLTSRPETLAKAWQDLPREFDRACDASVKERYGHSFAFWCWVAQRLWAWATNHVETAVDETDCEACRSHLKDLVRTLEVKEEDSDAAIEPKIVLLSRKIAMWAKEALVELDRRSNEMRIFQPEYTVFRRLLSRLERSAKDFPRSAAVRMNVVKGVLGHHLLEDLDEHLFELQEIAHVLDPIQVRQWRKGQSQPPDEEEPIAKRFAWYLLTRSERAESLPENLRTLYSLLESAGREKSRQVEGVKYRLPDLFDPFRERWTVKDEGAAGELKGDAFRYLGLVLKEIDLNHERHARSRGGPASVPEPAAMVSESQQGVELTISCRFPVTPDEIEELAALREKGNREEASPRGNLGRLWLLESDKEYPASRLQRPIKPSNDRTVASSGMGLYVANFAAAIVNWELRVLAVTADREVGSCEFHLQKGIETDAR